MRGEFAANYFSEYQKQKISVDKLKHPTTTGLTLYEQVNAWLSEITPGTRVDVTSIADLGLMGMTYQFIGGKDVSNKFRPTNVGFGLSYLFPLLVAVLASSPGALIIVENPEAHLHPRAQSRIGWLLATAAGGGLQIIVETHSEHVLNGARIAVKDSVLSPSDCKLAFFSAGIREDRFEHLVLTPVIDQSGRLDFWPEGFFDQADKDIDRVFGI
jgi:predicted ATPase